jgi:hypothetical protein
MPNSYPTPDDLLRQTQMLQGMKNANYAGGSPLAALQGRAAGPQGPMPNGLPLGANVPPNMQNPPAFNAPPQMQRAMQNPFGGQLPQALSPQTQQQLQLKQLSNGAPNTGFRSTTGSSPISLDAVLKEPSNRFAEMDSEAKQDAATIGLRPMMTSKYRNMDGSISFPVGNGQNDQTLSMHGGAGRMFGNNQPRTVDRNFGVEYTQNFAKGGYAVGGQADATAGVTKPDDISKLYQDILQRAPDQSGLEYWQNQQKNGMSLDDIANSFKNSDEAKIIGGYNDILGRAPDQSGLDYYRSQLQGGRSANDILNELKGSNEGQINADYQNVFGRNADQTGKQYYLDLLNTGKKTNQDIQDELLYNRPKDVEYNQQFAANNQTANDANKESPYTTWWGYTPNTNDATMLKRALLGEAGNGNYEQMRAIAEALGNRAALGAPFGSRNNSIANTVTRSQVEGAFKPNVKSLWDTDAGKLADQVISDYFTDQGRNKVLGTQTDWRNNEKGGYAGSYTPAGEASSKNTFFNSVNNQYKPNEELTKQLYNLQQSKNAYLPDNAYQKLLADNAAAAQKLAEAKNASNNDVPNVQLGYDPTTGNFTGFNNNPMEQAGFNGGLTVPTYTNNESLLNPNTYNGVTTPNTNYGGSTFTGINYPTTTSGGFDTSNALTVNPYSFAFEPIQYKEGGSVFKPMFEGDSQEMQDRAKELAKGAYTNSLSDKDRQEWFDLAKRYNLPLTPSMYNTYEDQYSDMLSKAQKDLNPNQKVQYHADGGAIHMAAGGLPDLTPAPAPIISYAQPGAGTNTPVMPTISTPKVRSNFTAPIYNYMDLLQKKYNPLLDTTPTTGTQTNPYVLNPNTYKTPNTNVPTVPTTPTTPTVPPAIDSVALAKTMLKGFGLSDSQIADLIASGWKPGDAVDLSKILSTPKVDPKLAANTASIKSLFNSVFGRDPTADELTKYLNTYNSTGDLLAIKNSLLQLPEAQAFAGANKYGVTKDEYSKDLTLLQDEYKKLFGRDYNPTTDDYWMKQLTAKTTDPTKLEGQLMGGAQGKDLLYEDYQKLFGRAPDPAGLDYWSKQLASGAISKDNLLQALAGGAQASDYDYLKAHPIAGITAPTGPVLSSTDQASNLSKYDAELKKDYQDLFGRAPDTAGEQYWANQLASGAVTPDNLIAALKGGATGADLTHLQQTQNPTTTNTTTDNAPTAPTMNDHGIVPAPVGNSGVGNDVVAQDYQNILGRFPDASGYQYWNNQLSSGAISPDNLASAIAHGVTAGGHGLNDPQYQSDMMHAADYLVNNNMVPASTIGESNNPILLAIRSDPASVNALKGAAALGIPGFGVYKKGGPVHMADGGYMAGPQPQMDIGGMDQINHLMNQQSDVASFAKGGKASPLTALANNNYEKESPNIKRIRDEFERRGLDFDGFLAHARNNPKA